MDVTLPQKTLKNLATLNVVIGRNGCGKSTLLRELDANRGNWHVVKYVSPERGGKTAYEATVENAIQSDPAWLGNSRRRNRDDNFREKSISQLKNLEHLINRKIAADTRNGLSIDLYFEDALAMINSVLDNVVLIQTDKLAPEIRGKVDNIVRTDEALSSGEKELITLAAEILYFTYEIKNLPDDQNTALLLLDEPDVHLHPDLQVRLMSLLAKAIEGLPITVIIATHSTAILGALRSEAAHVAFMKKEDSILHFENMNEALDKLLPVFGAHPLSNVFNQVPVLIVEGEDDERIWQQAVRTSQGKIKLWPCEAGSVDKINEYETLASKMIGSIYDDATGYSLRDKDNGDYEISDLPNLIRAKLNCYAAENLLLSDDALSLLGINWPEMQALVSEWLMKNGGHPKHSEMSSFASSFDRQNYRLKDLENIFVYLAGKSKPWEVLVGQAIARLNPQSAQTEGSLIDFLGSKIVRELSLNR